MKQNLLDNFIRVRVTSDDREFIEKYIKQTDYSISDLFRKYIKDLRILSDAVNSE